MCTIASRFELHEILCEILGTRNVYFQPPESVKMKYPAIAYELDDIESKYANDGVYFFSKKYQVTVIDEDPDSPIIDKIVTLPTCRFIRHFESDNLNHDVFVLHY